MAALNVYSKEQVDALLPDSSELVPSTSGASSGDVLTFDGSSVGWAAGGGGGGGGHPTTTKYSGYSSFFAAAETCEIGDQIFGSFTNSLYQAQGGAMSVCYKWTGGVSCYASIDLLDATTKEPLMYVRMVSFQSTQISFSGYRISDKAWVSIALGSPTSIDALITKMTYRHPTNALPIW